MLSCYLHDYIEIACLYKIPIVLSCINGDKYQGTPITTFITPEKLECLQLKIESSNQVLSISLESLQSMQALINNSHFDLVNFN